MPIQPTHFIDFSDKTEAQLISILQRSYDLLIHKKSAQRFALGQSAALVFLESSTRTRLSFETAVARLQIHPQIFDIRQATSLDKGETLEDTLLNILAMDPAVMILRCNEDLDVRQFIQQNQVQCPMINAGWGTKHHPTQAMGDVLTILADLTKDDLTFTPLMQKIKSKKLLIVGDVRHSRVAGSHQQLAQKLGYEVAFCGPKEFLPAHSDNKCFDQLNEALLWADYAMALRVQFERHSDKEALSKDSYVQNFQISTERLALLPSSKAPLRILHPGPVNWGLELHQNILRDPRQMILQQVQSGVLIRQSILEFVLSGQQPH
ncbi:MAG: aspartate/ornithine carbamoyltransferase family protein [Pseudobdellovibrionaceae bacterium]